MKVAETILQSVLILFCMVSLSTNLLALAIPAVILLLATIQVFGAVMYRLRGGKSAMRTVYGIMVILCLASLFLGALTPFFGVLKYSLVLSAVTAIYYNIICWKEVAKESNESF